MSAVVGEPGIGKTARLLHLTETVPQTWMITASPARASDSAVLEELAKATGAYAIRRGNAAQSEAIVRVLLDDWNSGYGAVRRKGLLIIDEAQHLRPSQIEIIRFLHDAAECGVVLAGNPHVTNRYYQRVGSVFRPIPKHAQILSRIAKILRIPASDPGDVRAICEAFGIEDDRVHQRLWPFAEEGGLRRVCHLLEQARVIAGKNEITFEHVDKIARTAEF